MKARSLKQITGLTFVLPGVMLIAAACGSSSAPSSAQEVPIAMHIPSAGEVAKQIGCGDYRNLGGAPGGGVVTSGTCSIGNVRYAIDTFGSMKARDRWLDMSTAFGLNVKWKTSTSVVYVSVHQKGAA